MTSGAPTTTRRRAEYREYGYDYPGDELWKISLEADFTYNGKTVTASGVHPQCDPDRGIKGWSCTEKRSGVEWDPGRLQAVRWRARCLGELHHRVELFLSPVL